MKRVEDFNGGCRSNRKGFFGAVVCLAAFGKKKMPRLAFFQELRKWISCFCVFIVIIA